ncbi:rhodanese-like domain-containing protein [Wenyingzhuangia sp. IMCC45574]
MIKTICIVVLVIWGLSYAQRLTAQVKFKRMNVTEFKNAISVEEVQLIDVRTPKEFVAGHIANAKNIDVLATPNFKLQIQKLDPSKPVYIYCRSGKRSLTALRILAKAGFEQAWDLKGGYMAWEQQR